MKKYRFSEIEHTADFGIKVWAENEKILFEKCAEIFENLLVEKKNLKAKEFKRVEVEGENKEELLLNLLRELLFVFETEKFVFKKIKIEFENENKLILTGKGETFDPEKHKKKLNIKAITYHNFYIKKKDKGFETQIIFDV
ncbi:MAG: archease [candidate division WOR-3 bacterium]